MSFKHYVPALIGRASAIPPNVVSIDKRGTARVHRADLAKAGIGELVAVMLDPDTFRIALHKPRSGDVGLKVCSDGSKGDRVQVSLSGAISELRLEPEAVAGRYEMIRKDDLLIVNLSDAGGVKLPEDSE